MKLKDLLNMTSPMTEKIICVPTKESYKEVYPYTPYENYTINSISVNQNRLFIYLKERK